MKKYELLNYLYTQDGTTPSSKIQTHLQISRRSVITYVKELNEECPGLIISSKNGYCIPDKNRARNLFLQSNEDFSYEGYPKRKIYILKKLLLNKEQLSIYSLADKLCVSDLTINKDLVKLRKELKENDLYLKTKNDFVSIVGEKTSQDKFLLNILNEELKNSMFSLESLQRFFLIVDVKQLKTAINEILRKNNYNIDDLSLQNYILHLAICIETSIEETAQNQCDQSNYDFTVHFEDIIFQINDKLKLLYPNAYFTINQIKDLSILMSTRAVSNKIDGSTKNEIVNLVDKDIQSLLKEINSAIYTNYGINLDNDDFMLRFAVHLKNLITRAKNNITLPNNSFESIKQDYPFIYMIASNIISMISSFTGLDINKNETVYIALHLGIMMEAKNESLKKIKCVLVTHSYYDLSKVTFNKISANIPELYLEYVVSSYDDIDIKAPIDLVITIFDICPSLPFEQVKIAQLPTDKDIEQVEEKVKIIQRSLGKKELARNLRVLFDPSLFIVDRTFKSGYWAIDYLCNNMENGGFVTKEFKNDIYHHENDVPTEYLNVAIPHPLVASGNHVQKSVISVWINKKSIHWINNDVNFIFMVALKDEDKPLFSKIFNCVTSAVTNELLSNKLLDCTSFKEFMNILLSTTN